MGQTLPVAALAQSRGLPEHPLGIDRALSTLLATGSGPCLEIGCGTGEWAALVRELGRTPFGVDLSAGVLGYAKGRLPVARADARHPPLRALDASGGNHGDVAH